MKDIRLQLTALGGRVMAGHPNKAGTQITLGSRQDVTSDFMKCLIEKASHEGGGFEIHGAGRTWEVIVTELVPDEPSAQGDGGSGDA